MPTMTILLAEQDPVAARTLAATLDSQLCSVKMFISLHELRAALLQVRADAVIADLETVSLTEVAGLCRDFRLPVICTHRIPDDELWMASIDAGAIDVCEKSDVHSLLGAIMRAGPAARPLAA
jgi:DNA-binding NtrC family response regulator